MAASLSKLRTKIGTLYDRIAQLEWREEWHPREPRGATQGKGGQFAPKGMNTVAELREQIKMLEAQKERKQKKIAEIMTKSRDSFFGSSLAGNLQVEITQLDTLLRAKREQLLQHVTDTASPAQDVLLPGAKPVRWRTKPSRARVLKQQEEKE